MMGHDTMALDAWLTVQMRFQDIIVLEERLALLMFVLSNVEMV